MKQCILAILLVWLSTSHSRAESQPVKLRQQADVIIYGGTSAAVIAAVQTKRAGKSVIIVCPDKHLGGLSSGGLGWTDTGKKEVIGGLARDFYHRVWLHYQKPSAWTFQKQEDYGGRGQGTHAIDGDLRTMWIFEPHVAEMVFEDYVREFDIPVYRDQWLNRVAGDQGVKKSNGSIESITMLSGSTFLGKVFIDATYEGDLMASAGVDYHVGREASDVYGEAHNGVQIGVLHHGHHFDAIPNKTRIDPYVIPGDPGSGILPRISPDPPGEKGSGDRRVQAYCFRMCLTRHPENRIPFEKPEDYDPGEYELMARIFDAGWDQTFVKFDPIPNRKTDTNNHGPMSTDNIGKNYDYPEASYEKRNRIIKEHEAYQRGWLYFVANDPRVPESIRTEMQSWGLARDEFTDNHHWPHQIYVREARRMIGQFVMTENELTQKKPTPMPIGMGSYSIDSHNVQRYITPEGHVQNEGDIQVRIPPYQIAYGSLVPRKKQCRNLLVPVCVSSSHIAFGSIRMEPVFMILGESAATAACQAIDGQVAVQDIDYPKLKETLQRNGQVLETTAQSGRQTIDPGKLKGIVVDDQQCEPKGSWIQSAAISPFVGAGYRHDDAVGDGSCRVAFRTRLPHPGEYEVRIAYTANANRATNVPITVHGKDDHAMTINQRVAPRKTVPFLSLGTFVFGETAALTVSNQDTDGHVIIDAVQWLPRE